MHELRERVRAFSPALLFGTFLVLFFGMMSALKLEDPETLPTAPAAAEEVRARIAWGASFVVLGVVTVWNLVISATTVWLYVRRRGRLAVLVFAGIAAVVLGLMTRYGGAAGQGLLQNAETVTKVPLSPLTAMMNVSVVVTIVFVIGACIALGYRPTWNIGAQDLRQRIFDLRVMLFSSAVLLVVGVAEIFFLFDWSRSVPPAPGAHIAATASLAPALARTAGALFTFILLIIYAPTAVAHERWRLDLNNALHAGDPSFDTESWEKKHGLLSSALNNMVELTAIVSPMLTALGLPAIVLK